VQAVRRWALSLCGPGSGPGQQDAGPPLSLPALAPLKDYLPAASGGTSVDRASVAESSPSSGPAVDEANRAPLVRASRLGGVGGQRLVRQAMVSSAPALPSLFPAMPLQRKVTAPAGWLRSQQGAAVVFSAGPRQPTGLTTQLQGPFGERPPESPLPQAPPPLPFSGLQRQAAVAPYGSPMAEHGRMVPASPSGGAYAPPPRWQKVLAPRPVKPMPPDSSAASTEPSSPLSPKPTGTGTSEVGVEQMSRASQQAWRCARKYNPYVAADNKLWAERRKRRDRARDLAAVGASLLEDNALQ